MADKNQDILYLAKTDVPGEGYDDLEFEEKRDYHKTIDGKKVVIVGNVKEGPAIRESEKVDPSQIKLTGDRTPDGRRIVEINGERYVETIAPVSSTEENLSSIDGLAIRED